MTKIVCLDPGHGGSDSGACGNGIQEKDITLIVAKKVRSYLQNVGYQVVMTRETDKDVGYAGDSAGTELQARCVISNDASADVFVSIHCNSAGSIQAKGTEVFYYAGSEEGEKLATCIDKQLIGLGLVDRGTKDDPLYVTHYTDAVAALAELAFISNTEDAAKLADAKWQDEFARAVARGITDYFV
jgi:N-acetylmuramoyl-L-alanine amidase